MEGYFSELEGSRGDQILVVGAFFRNREQLRMIKFKIRVGVELTFLTSGRIRHPPLSSPSSWKLKKCVQLIKNYDPIDRVARLCAMPPKFTRFNIFECGLNVFVFPLP